MNLTKLFETQRKLDERIVKEKRLEGQDLTPMKILALQVELGELANEWRGFKFWSENREPRTSMLSQLFKEDGTPARGVKVTNPLLEEYVDCLHFILSIGLSHKFDEALSGLAIEPISIRIVDSFTALMRTEWETFDDGSADYFHGGLELFIGLGESLGFTWEQIEQAYYDKNQINHERQTNGY